MIIREFVFEDVRRQSFNEKPSRFKGIWLIPHNEQVLAHWCATAPQGQFRAFEVEATGRFHHGLSRHLKPECVGVADILKKAQRYWSEPADVLAEPAEILCEGEIKILRQLEVAGSETTVWRKLKNLF